MAYEEIVEWSNADERPAWQKDALRRIATSGEVSTDDLEELRSFIEKDVGLVDLQVTAIVPLAAEHLSTATTDAPRTVLGSIGPVRRIDRLASDQPPIKFAKNGVTLIYGGNASGKSGYCRIAKQVCRSVSPKEVQGNVYEDPPADPPEVDLVFGIEGEALERREATWRRGDPSPIELARISVFDTETARVYVDKNRKVEFLPYELDLLNKLALAAKSLDSSFQEREKVLDGLIRTPLPGGYVEGSEVSKILKMLTPETTQEDLPNETELRDLSSWSEVKEAELQSIYDEKRADPRVKNGVCKSAKQELENIRIDLSVRLALLGDEGISKLVEVHTEMVSKTAVAEAAARGLGGGMPIPDIGSEAWRRMLFYAREFAGEAFSDRESPKLVTGETCVLCQQELDASASDRMAKFDQYISGRAASDSQEAVKALDEIKGSILALPIKAGQQAEDLLGVYRGLSDLSKSIVAEVSNAYEVLSARHEAIRAMIESGAFSGVEGLSPIQIDLIDKIDTEIAELQRQIDALETTEANNENVETKPTEQAELEDTKRLSQEIETVVERLKRLEERHKILDARKQCASGPIARQLTQRRRAVLTESLKAQLTDELKALKLSHIPINLSDRSAGGDSLIEVGLTAQQRVANNSDVLSEGEQRALALSCFLAELTEVGAAHGIIIDDPVSSLDHSRMEAVAKRLVAEAASGRQVIIFTHNIVFHYMVENETRRAGLPCHTEWMSSQGGTKFGIIDDSGKPSHAKKARTRVGELDAAKSRLFKDGYDPAMPKFRDPLTAIYTLMRETWERIIEEILFNGTIQRFRPEIMTQSLKHACYDPANDYPAIFEGMKRCSHYSGHDRAVDLPPELPQREDIETDLKALIEFYEKVSARKSALEKGHSYEKGVEPEFL